MNAQKRCAYEGCSESAWSESPKGFCLYHAPENDKDEETARKVWQDARGRAQQLHQTFAGWHFPRDPDYEGFKKATFLGPADFCAATFQGMAVFNDATFLRKASFRGATFQGNARFDRANFQGDAWFHGATFQDGAHFCAATFRGSAGFGATFQSLARFSDARFQGDASFHDATFQGGALFGDATFQSDAWFHGATFQDIAAFDDATFQDRAWFAGATVAKGQVLFLRLPSWELPFVRATPFRLREEGETAYRLAKQSAYDRGDYAAAGKYHYAERCARECGKRKALGWKFWRLGRFLTCLFEYVFARGIFGYGEKPHRALFLAIALIAGFACLGHSMAGITPDPKDSPDYQASFRESLHFSVVTFTTLGYGDFEPKPFYRLYADGEALMGAALLAVFIVGLTRKYMR